MQQQQGYITPSIYAKLPISEKIILKSIAAYGPDLLGAAAGKNKYLSSVEPVDMRNEFYSREEFCALLVKVGQKQICSNNFIEGF